MFELKSLSASGVTAALAKAKHYRLLNEPYEAESICRDVLELEPENQDALVTLLLALTDQFDRRAATRYKQALQVCRRLTDAYHRVYYEGIIYERRGLRQIEVRSPDSGYVAYDWFMRAMVKYEAAEAVSPPDNDDAILRWNTCARIIMQNPDLKPQAAERYQPYFE